MADKKISALTGATTPLAGTEVLPIVQGGSTVKVSIANVTAGRAVSTGALSVVGANVTLDNAFSLAGKLAGGTPVGMMRRNSSDEVAIDEDGYGTKIGFGGRYNFAGGGDFTVGIGNLVVGTAGKGITTGGATALGLGVNNAVDAITINTSSNVGVGTNSPSQKVQVHGLVAVSNLGSGQNAMGAIGAANVDAVNGSLLLYSRTADAMTEKVRITYTGNVGVGTSTPTSGSMDNGTIVNAGVFSTFRGSVASTSGVAVTIATSNQNHQLATYIVSCGISSGAPTVYSAVAIVSADNNVLRITNLQTASLMTLSVSGTDIQATQSSGGAATILFAVTRIA